MQLLSSSGPVLIGLRPQSKPVNTEPPGRSTLIGNRGIRGNPNDGLRTNETANIIQSLIEGHTERNSGN